MPSVEYSLYYAISSDAIFAFDNILLNLATAITFALILAIFSSCYDFYSVSNFFLISDHSTSLDIFANFNLSRLTISFFLSR